MKFSQKLACITLGSILLLSGVVSINVHAEAPADGRIAFTSNRDGNWNIYVMDAHGSHLRQVTNLLGDERYPSWSPDGRRIAFSSHFHPDGRSHTDIYAVDADGGNLRKLTNDPPVWGLSPSWSPDGQQIAFASTRDGNYEIYVMDADAANLRRLTNRPTAEWCPVWSPDGQQIAFVSGVYGKGFGISVMDANGENIRQLVTRSWWDSCLTWSPDGQSIAFSFTQEWPPGDIYVMDVAGKNLRNLTNHHRGNRDPDWFNPALARIVSVSPAGRLPLTWGWIKRTR